MGLVPSSSGTIQVEKKIYLILRNYELTLQPIRCIRTHPFEQWKEMESQELMDLMCQKKKQISLIM